MYGSGDSADGMAKWIKRAVAFLIGVALGVATLIVVLSVMGGFREQLLGRIIGMNGHVVIAARGGLIQATPDLLARLDAISAERGYPSRSRAMADFIRRAIVKKEWKCGSKCAGTISIVYDPADSRPGRGVEDAG